MGRRADRKSINNIAGQIHGVLLLVPATSQSMNRKSFVSFRATLKMSLHAPVKLLPVTRSLSEMGQRRKVFVSGHSISVAS